MKLLTRIPSLLRNKFLLTTVAFLLWMLFFDKHDIFTQLDRKRELRALQESKVYYLQQIRDERRFAEELKNNPGAIEKFAREHYKMKKENEDLFLIQPARQEEN